MPIELSGSSGITTPGLASDSMPTSGGSPVVESGSNSDGEWVRWADGTQICGNTLTSPDSYTTATDHFGDSSGVMTYYHNDWQYPIAFVGVPRPSSEGGYRTTTARASESSSCSTRQYASHDAAFNEIYVSATGRWK